MEHWSRALQFQTVSSPDLSRIDPAEFLALHDYLERTFPGVHATLTREIIGDYSLLYTWKGTDPNRKPILLMSHPAVVPVELDIEEEWEYPPFEGRVAEGLIWGRGAQTREAPNEHRRFDEPGPSRKQFDVGSPPDNRLTNAAGISGRKLGPRGHHPS